MIAEQLAEILRSEKKVKGFKKDTFENHLPDDLNDCQAFYVEAGGAQTLNIPEHEMLVTLVVRREKYAAAKEFSFEAFKFFNRKGFLLPNGRRLVVHHSAPPRYLDTDMRDRAVFTYTFTCTVNIM